jgi:hypothetical protein
MLNETAKNYLSGYISGVSAIIVSHPIDTIKTNYQEKIKMSYSLRNLYRGIMAPILGIGLEKAVVFGTYDLINSKLNNYAISGAIAGLSASFIVTPYERLKILLQTSNKSASAKVGFHNFTTESHYIRYMFQGLSATFYREVPGFAIYFSLYNNLKDYTIEKRGELKMYEAFSYGGLSGAVSWLFIYPQDRIKTHIQSASESNITVRESLKYVLNDGGIRGLYRGFHLALLRAVPLHATAFMVNELCKSIMFSSVN